jgi:hypothetical protein
MLLSAGGSRSWYSDGGSEGTTCGTDCLQSSIFVPAIVVELADVGVAEVGKYNVAIFREVFTRCTIGIP